MERIGMSDIDGNAARVAGASAGARVTNKDDLRKGVNKAKVDLRERTRNFASIIKQLKAASENS